MQPHDLAVRDDRICVVLRERDVAGDDGKNRNSADRGDEGLQCWHGGLRRCHTLTARLPVCVANARRELIDVFEHVLQHAIRVHSGPTACKAAFVQEFHLQQHRRCGVRQLRRGM